MFYNYEFVKNYFDLQNVYDFCSKQTVKITTIKNGDFKCTINGKKYSIENDFFSALITGIKNYECTQRKQ